MADEFFVIKKDTLNDIGDAIRAKTGSEDLIDPVDMPAEIDGIQAGGGGLQFAPYPEGITFSGLKRFDINGCTLLAYNDNSSGALYLFRNGTFELLADNFAGNTFVETELGVLIQGYDWNRSIGCMLYFSKKEKTASFLCDGNLSSPTIVETSIGTLMMAGTSTSGAYTHVFRFDDEKQEATLIGESVSKGHYFTRVHELTDGVLLTTFKQYDSSCYLYINRTTMETWSGVFSFPELNKNLENSIAVIASEGKQHYLVGYAASYPTTHILAIFDEESKTTECVMPENNASVRTSSVMNAGEKILISPGLNTGGVCVFDKSEKSFIQIIDETSLYRFCECGDFVFVFQVGKTGTIYCFNKLDNSLSEVTGLTAYADQSDSIIAIAVDNGSLILGLSVSVHVNGNLEATKPGSTSFEATTDRPFVLVDLGAYIAVSSIMRSSTRIFRKSDGMMLSSYPTNMITEAWIADNGKYVLVRPDYPVFTEFDPSTEKCKSILTGYPYKITEKEFVIFSSLEATCEVQLFDLETYESSVLNGDCAVYSGSCSYKFNRDGNLLVATVIGNPTYTNINSGNETAPLSTAVDLETKETSVIPTKKDPMLCRKGIYYE